MNVNAVPPPAPDPGDERPRSLAGGGGPPYDSDMDRRLTVLETRFDTILPTLVTKAEFYAAMGKIDVQFANMQLEIEKLRTEMHQMFATLMKWWIGLTVTLIASFAGMFYSILRAISP